MIFLYASIVIILFGFFIVKSQKNQHQSQTGICSICDKSFPDSELQMDETLSFCPEHFKVYNESNWIISKSVECSVGNEKESVELYEQKLKNFQNSQLGFLKTSYKEVNGEIITTLDYYIQK